MKVYIAGKITGLENYKEKFARAERALRDKSEVILSPTILPSGLSHDEYLQICFTMIDVCDTIYFLDDWEDSEGAKMEHDYALKEEKEILYQEKERICAF